MSSRSTSPYLSDYTTEIDYCGGAQTSIALVDERLRLHTLLRVIAQLSHGAVLFIVLVMTCHTYNHDRKSFDKKSLCANAK